MAKYLMILSCTLLFLGVTLLVMNLAPGGLTTPTVVLLTWLCLDLLLVAGVLGGGTRTGVSRTGLP